MVRVCRQWFCPASVWIKLDLLTSFNFKPFPLTLSTKPNLKQMVIATVFIFAGRPIANSYILILCVCVCERERENQLSALGVCHNSDFLFPLKQCCENERLL